MIVESSSISDTYVTFLLDGQVYGIPVAHVREITGLMPISRVPHAPSHLLGVTNMRGHIIAIIDLRSRFNLPPVESRRDNCLIILELGKEEKQVSFGIKVDSVSEVLSAGAGALQAAPSMGENVDTSHIVGLIDHEAGLTMILDVNQLLSEGEIRHVSHQVMASVLNRDTVAEKSGGGGS